MTKQIKQAFYWVSVREKTKENSSHFIENCAKPNVTSFNGHTLLFVKPNIENLQKIGNEKPRFALNLLLMTNFVSKKNFCHGLSCQR